MKQIGAAKFKQECLGILDRLDPEGVVITKHGRPVARLIPFDRGSGSLIDSLRGRIKILGELESTGIEWEAGAQS
jgi:prevent-host-death family protein